MRLVSSTGEYGELLLAMTFFVFFFSRIDAVAKSMKWCMPVKSKPWFSKVNQAANMTATPLVKELSAAVAKVSTPNNFTTIRRISVRLYMNEMIPVSRPGFQVGWPTLFGVGSERLPAENAFQCHDLTRIMKSNPAIQDPGPGRSGFRMR